MLLTHFVSKIAAVEYAFNLSGVLAWMRSTEWGAPRRFLLAHTGVVYGKIYYMLMTESSWRKPELEFCTTNTLLDKLSSPNIFQQKNNLKNFTLKKEVETSDDALWL